MSIWTKQLYPKKCSLWTVQSHLLNPFYLSIIYIRIWIDKTLWDSFLLFLAMHVCCGLMVIIRWTQKYFVIADMGLHGLASFLGWYDIFYAEVQNDCALLCFIWWATEREKLKEKERKRASPRRELANKPEITVCIQCISIYFGIEYFVYLSNRVRKIDSSAAACSRSWLGFSSLPLFCLYIIYTFYKNQHLMSINRTCDVSGQLWI